MFLAVLSYIYIRFLYGYIGPKYEYQIKKTEKLRKGWNIYLAPLESKMTYKPAQFVSVSFINDEVSKEFHPFSISSSPGDDLIRLTIKKLGDYTTQLDGLRVSDKAILFGPYGRFYEKYLAQSDKDAVFFSGGIGITPFLSMLGYEADHPTNRITYIFYCVKNQERADFHEEILGYVEKNQNIRYFPVFANLDGFLTLSKALEKIEGPPTNKNYFLCGPYPMIESFEKDLRRAKVKNRDILFEDFNLLD